MMVGSHCNSAAYISSLGSHLQASPAETVQNQAGIQKDDLDLIW
jgi:hypothetical protein